MGGIAISNPAAPEGSVSLFPQIPKGPGRAGIVGAKEEIGGWAETRLGTTTPENEAADWPSESSARS